MLISKCDLRKAIKLQYCLLFAVYRKPGLTPGRGQNIYNCDYDRPPNENQVCDVDVKDWFPCTQENHFNYHKSAPCIFIKLNKVTGTRTSRTNSMLGVGSIHDVDSEQILSS
jgi:hypothetical protein